MTLETLQNVILYQVQRIGDFKSLIVHPDTLRDLYVESMREGNDQLQRDGDNYKFMGYDLLQSYDIKKGQVQCAL